MSPENPSHSPPPEEDSGSRDTKRRRLFADLTRAGEEREEQPDADAFREEAERDIEARMAGLADEEFVPGGTLPQPPVAPGPEGTALPSSGKIVSFPTLVRRQRTAFLAIAAAVLGFAGLAAWFFQGRTSSSPQEMALRDGPLEIRADGSFRVSASLPDGLTQSLGEIIRRRSLGLPEPTTPDPLRGGDSHSAAEPPSASPVKLLSPWPGAAVESLQPVLRWEHNLSVAPLSVLLEDMSEDSNPQSSGDLPTVLSFWQPPKPLVRGGLYRWTVRTSSGVGAAVATFRVLTPEAAEAVAEARRDLAGSHLLLAVVYDQAGLLSEAHAELLALAAANPTSVLARDLAASSERR